MLIFRTTILGAPWLRRLNWKYPCLESTLLLAANSTLAIPKNPLQQINSVYSICLGAGSGILTFGKMQSANLSTLVKIPFRVFKDDYYPGITGL
jgi:hypothetical protein